MAANCSNEFSIQQVNQFSNGRRMLFWNNSLAIAILLYWLNPCSCLTLVHQSSLTRGRSSHVLKCGCWKRPVDKYRDAPVLKLRTLTDQNTLLSTVEDHQSWTSSSCCDWWFPRLWLNHIKSPSYLITWCLTSLAHYDITMNHLFSNYHIGRTMIIRNLIAIDHQAFLSRWVCPQSVVPTIAIQVQFAIIYRATPFLDKLMSVNM